METILRAMGEMVQIATADVRKMNGRTTRTHIDLFSGIGGFALACRWAGIETIVFCEIEKYAQRVLRKNFPGIRIFEDVQQFPATQFREPFLLTGGYPCGPFSQAGKRRGAEDDRHLWPSMFGIIRTSRPTWILAENVAGHVTLGLDQVLADLESEDYAVQPIIVPACSVDAPHRRDRVWVIANAEDKRGCRKNEYEECFKQDREEWFQGQPRRDSSLEFVPDSNNARRVKQWRSESIQSELITAECGNRWSAEPDVGRVAHGIPKRVDRLRGLGNAIVPQVAYEIIKAMIEADESA
jgi:DNA (cytosine-5)-methyltransferase 1